jgi:hypothetical protein
VKSTGQLGKAIQRPAPLPRSSQQVTQQTERLTEANLVLVVAQKSDNPAILDTVHKGPGENLDRLLDFSHLWDGLECDGADLLSGSSEHGVPGIRQMSKLPMFFHSKGDKRSLITWAWLEETIALRSAFADMDSQKGDFSRVVRGLHT